MKVSEVPMYAKHTKRVPFQRTTEKKYTVVRMCKSDLGNSKVDNDEYVLYELEDIGPMYHRQADDRI